MRVPWWVAHELVSLIGSHTMPGQHSQPTLTPNSEVGWNASVQRASMCTLESISVNNRSVKSGSVLQDRKLSRNSISVKLGNKWAADKSPWLQAFSRQSDHSIQSEKVLNATINSKMHCWGKKKKILQAWKHFTQQNMVLKLCVQPFSCIILSCNTCPPCSTCILCVVGGGGHAHSCVIWGNKDLHIF